MSTKGKSWIAKKTIHKSFKAAVELRKQVIQAAFKHIHSGAPLIVANEEHNIILRRNSVNGFVQDYVEELRSLDEIISKLSKFL